MKTVIHVWTHNFNISQNHIDKYNFLKETNFYFGLGDLIRSTIKLYELSKRMNFRFLVDVQLHPISEFLNIDQHEYTSYVDTNKDNIDYVCYGAVEDYINEHSENDIMLILTNDFYDGEMPLDCKHFIKKIFTPSKCFEDFIQNKKQKIPYTNYNILHYRIGDNDFVKSSNDMNDCYEYCLDHFLKHKEENDILVTDTKSLKQYLYLNSDIFIFDTKICHLGLSKDSDAVRDTLFEFFLITQSSKIKTYCKIHHISGFVKWISKVYDIPIECFN